MGLTGIGLAAAVISGGGQSARANPNELSPEEQQEVQRLRQTDRKVRAHEQAHKTVGGPYAGAISYETVTGPDGRQYAVAGEVEIDVSPVPNNPEATIRKMTVVERAALAPPEPSPQDIAVARTAQQLRLQAQQQLSEQRLEESRQGRESGSALISAQSNANPGENIDVNQLLSAFEQTESLSGAETRQIFTTEA